MTIVEKVRDICRARRIPISRLEQDLHFSNGYLNPKKTKDIPAERLAAIAEYFDVPIENIFLGDADIKKNPAPNSTGLPQEFIDMVNCLSAQGKADLDKYLRFLISLEAGK